MYELNAMNKIFDRFVCVETLGLLLSAILRIHKCASVLLIATFTSNQLRTENDRKGSSAMTI